MQQLSKVTHQQNLEMVEMMTRKCERSNNRYALPRRPEKERGMPPVKHNIGCWTLDALVI